MVCIKVKLVLETIKFVPVSDSVSKLLNTSYRSHDIFIFLVFKFFDILLTRDSFDSFKKSQVKISIENHKEELDFKTSLMD